MVLNRVAPLALCAACASLPDYTANVCGNGVVEPGEDCDGQATCKDCSWTCDTGNCPGDFYCGVDHVCRAPSGAFPANEASEFVFPVFGGVAGDVNSDGIPDVVGVSSASFVITYGTSDGVMRDQTTQVTPAHGVAGVAQRFFGPHTTELLVGSAEGIAGYTPVSQLLLPYPFGNALSKQFGQCAPLMTGSLQPLAVFGFDGGHLNVVAFSPSQMTVMFGVIDVMNATCAFADACGLTYTPDPSGNLPSVAFDNYNTGTLAAPSEIAAFSRAPPGATSLGATCVMRV
jgi:hypothetical protein